MGKAFGGGGATMEQVTPSSAIRSRTGQHKPTITGPTHAWTVAKAMCVFQEEAGNKATHYTSRRMKSMISFIKRKRKCET
jgi:hypothetical protein